MAHPLIGIHAVLGEIGIFAFGWVFVELLNPTAQRLKRAHIIALLGVIFFILSWITGGIYYVEFYGSIVKPIIKEGPQPWAHTVVMEAKEHIFLFIPFLAIINYLLIKNLKIQDNKKRKSILMLSALIVALGLLMALMGYLIATGLRSALEVMHVS
ncbi:MAG: hypothetical protein AABX72_01030 [Nanoarchaeota archaeon]